jgi:hypothetical protein
VRLIVCAATLLVVAGSVALFETRLMALEALAALF